MPLQDILYTVPTIRKAWQAGDNLESDHDVPFVDMCEDINICINKTYLTTSSKLIFGAARIYKTDVEELHKDVIKLAEDLRTDRKKTYVGNEHTPATSSATQPGSTIDLTSTTHSVSISPPTSPLQPGHISQPRTTPQPSFTPHPKSPSELRSTSQTASKSHLESPHLQSSPYISSTSSQPRLPSQLRSPSQPGSTINPKSLPETESAFIAGSKSRMESVPGFTVTLVEKPRSPSQLRSSRKFTSQPRSTSKPGSTSQPTSISEPGTTSQPRTNSQPRSTSETKSSSQTISSFLEETQRSESSTDHEDYFPLSPDSPEQMRHSGYESDYEDISPTYTTIENKQRESPIILERYRPGLSTINEENSLMYRSAGTSIIDRSIQSNRSNSKRTSGTRENVEFRKKQKSDRSKDLSEVHILDKTWVLDVTNKEISHTGPNSNNASIRTSSGSVESSNTDVEREKSNSELVTKRLESRKRRNSDTFHNTSEVQTLDKTRISDATQEALSNTEKDLDKAFIRTTDGSIENLDTDERDTTPSEPSIILQSSSILKANAQERKIIKNKTCHKGAGIANTRDQNTQTSLPQSNVMESGQCLDAPTSSRIRDKMESGQLIDAWTYPRVSDNVMQSSHLQSNIVQLLDETSAKISDPATQINPPQSNVVGQLVNTATLRVRDGDTQVSPVQANTSVLEQPISFDRELPFGVLFRHFSCQCDQRVPCVIIYSSMEE